MATEYREERFDYTDGEKNRPELIVLVGISGSGKSTLVAQLLQRSQGKTVRLNRDSMRMMLFGPKATFNKSNEQGVRNWQMEGARMWLQMGKNVIIDDTNCIRQTRQKWEEFAVEMHVNLKLVTFEVPLKTAVERDIKRGIPCPTCKVPPGAMVGEEVIRRQYKDLTSFAMTEKPQATALTRPYFERQALLKGGFVPRLPGRPWVLVDVDGTLAKRGDRGRFDEMKVGVDELIEGVAAWVRALYPFFNIAIVSGRQDYCGDLTCEWLEVYEVPFDRIIMRRSRDNRSDFIVKEEILNELRAVLGDACGFWDNDMNFRLPAEGIAFVLDDRPQVVKMWRKHGLVVFPVRGTWKHSDGCTERDKEKPWYKDGYCGECGALEDF